MRGAAGDAAAALLCSSTFFWRFLVSLRTQNIMWSAINFCLSALPLSTETLKLGDVKYKFQLASGLPSRKELLGGCGAQGKKLTLK